MADIHKRWGNPDHEAVNPASYDWRSAIAAPLREGDMDGLKSSSSIPAQFGMIQLAHEAESEAVRFNALQFLLSQNGHGPVGKVEHTVDYKKLPTEQLESTVKSKLQLIHKLNPNFNLQALLTAAGGGLSSPEIEAEFEEVAE